MTPRSRSQRTFPIDEAGAAALPAVTSRDQIDPSDGARVRLIGAYVQIDARMAAIPPPRHLGHVAIRLDDGTLVSLLPVWSFDALRPETEIASFEGRDVEVIGVLHAIAPREPHGGACPVSPAITDVGAIRPRRV
jgi:hypothetical protein